MQQKSKYFIRSKTNDIIIYSANCEEPLNLDENIEKLIGLGYFLKINEYIVFDVVWILEKFSCLVRDFYLHPNFGVDTELLKDDKMVFEWKMLTQHGVLSDDVLNVLWQEKKIQQT